MYTKVTLVHKNKMDERDATYNEWLSANKYRRWKYKYGLIVVILSWISLLLLCYFVVHYSKELSEHPIRYTMHKFDLNSCTCFGESEMYLINKTAIMVTQNPYRGFP